MMISVFETPLPVVLLASGTAYSQRVRVILSPSQLSLVISAETPAMEKPLRSLLLTVHLVMPTSGLALNISGTTAQLIGSEFIEFIS